MHQNGARCFLNTEDDCAADPTPGAEDPPYDLLIKSPRAPGPAGAAEGERSQRSPLIRCQ